MYAILAVHIPLYTFQLGLHISIRNIIIEPANKGNALETDRSRRFNRA